MKENFSDNQDKFDKNSSDGLLTEWLRRRRIAEGVKQRKLDSWHYEGCQETGEVIEVTLSVGVHLDPVKGKMCKECGSRIWEDQE